MTLHDSHNFLFPFNRVRRRSSSVTSATFRDPDSDDSSSSDRTGIYSDTMVHSARCSISDGTAVKRKRCKRYIKSKSISPLKKQTHRQSDSRIEKLFSAPSSSQSSSQTGNRMPAFCQEFTFPTYNLFHTNTKSPSSSSASTSSSSSIFTAFNPKLYDSDLSSSLSTSPASLSFPLSPTTRGNDDEGMVSYGEGEPIQVDSDADDELEAEKEEEASRLHSQAFADLRASTTRDEEGFVEKLRKWEESRRGSGESCSSAPQLTRGMPLPVEEEVEEVEVMLEIGGDGGGRARARDMDVDELANKLCGGGGIEDYEAVRLFQARRRKTR